MDADAVFLVHAEVATDVLRSVPGVEDVQELTPTVALVRASLSRSRLYHEVKWAGLEGAAVVVAELRSQPKATRVAPGAVAWIREHLPKG